MVKRRATLRGVAEKAGVSLTTVSFVLNGRTEANISEDTQKRVVEAAKALGYAPSSAAKALVSGRSQTLGFIVDASNHFPSFVTAELQFGILSVARQHNLRLLVDELQETEQSNSYMELAQAKSIDGLIIHEPTLNNPGIDYLSNHNFPVVVLGNLPGNRLSTIDFDNYGGARAVMEHLLSLGHTRIACITHTPNMNASGAFERFKAYREALAEAGISYNEELVRYSNGTEADGYEGMMSLLNTHLLPTAVFGLNDRVAVGAMAAIHEKGLKIPHDIAVAGFDGSAHAAYQNPSLTSVKLSFSELGRLAGEMLIDLVEEQKEPGHHVKIPTHLIIRKSTDPGV